MTAEQLCVCVCNGNCASKNCEMNDDRKISTHSRRDHRSYVRFETSTVKWALRIWALRIRALHSNHKSNQKRKRKWKKNKTQIANRKNRRHDLSHELIVYKTQRLIENKYKSTAHVHVFCT